MTLLVLWFSLFTTCDAPQTFFFLLQEFELKEFETFLSSHQLEISSYRKTSQKQKYHSGVQLSNLKL